MCVYNIQAYKKIKIKKAHKIRAKRQLCVYSIHTVALIRTLAIKPDILLLDEPFSALDYVNRLNVSKDVYEILKKENMTVIMITHDIGEAVSLSDRIVVLSKRPAIVKDIYKLDFKEEDPIKKRSTEEFNKYYNTIWQEIEK